MSAFDLEEIALETNIRLKELELIRLMEENNPWTFQADAFSDHSHLPLVKVIPVQETIFAQFDLNKIWNVWDGKNSTFNLHDAIKTFHTQPLFNLSGYDVNNKIATNSQCVASYPGYAAKALPIKKFKNNRKKNFLTPKCSSHTPMDYKNVIVNLKEIGFGYPRIKPLDKNRLILQFRRIYIYLSSLCKERSILESIIFAKEHNVVGKYVQPANVSVAGHFEYTLKNLSIEVKFVESMISKIQQRCDDSMFVNMYCEHANNFLSAVNMLTFFKGPDILYDVNNTDVIRRVDDALTSVITSIRYMGVIYTITAQKLLIKETNALQCRRKVFIGR